MRSVVICNWRCVGLLTALVLSACGGDAEPAAGSSSDPLLGAWSYSGHVPDFVNVTLTFKADKTLSFVEQVSPASEPAGTTTGGCITTDVFSATYTEAVVGHENTLHWTFTSGTANIVTGCSTTSLDSAGTPMTMDGIADYIDQGIVFPTTVTYTATSTTLLFTSAGHSGLGGSSGTTFAKAAATENTGATGAAGASNGEDELTCAVPNASGCPAGLIPYSGQKEDSVNHCRLPSAVLSCSAGASAAETCWVDTDTGDLYELDEIPCKPEAKWQDCTQAQSDEISALPPCK